MEESKNLMLLKSFCGNDDIRKWVKKPFQYNYDGQEYYCGTDAHRMLLVPIDMIPEGIDEHKHEIKNNSLFEVDKIGIHIFFDDINKAYELCPEVDEMNNDQIDCLDCDSEGVIECDWCGHESECDKCDGEGVTEKATPTGKKIKSEKAIIEINNINFFSKMFFVLKNIADFNESKEIIHLTGTKNLASLFQIDRMILLIMPAIGGIEKPFCSLPLTPDNHNK